jgi:hypothetical protein
MVKESISEAQSSKRHNLLLPIIDVEEVDNWQRVSKPQQGQILPCSQ